uniref:Meiotic recombination protein REC114 n=1 Tax=Amphimedon queenslandica TaxID=400682 RepID=A0A1X7UUK4_AMPQE
MNESKQIWLVDKYARLVASREPSALSLSQDQGEGNSWQHYNSSPGKQILLVLINKNHFMITHGDTTLESFILWGTSNWIKGVAKGDSILFLYHHQMSNRRFRIKLSGGTSGVGLARTGVENCRDAVSVLRGLMPVKVIDDISQISQEETSGSSKEGESLRERAQSISKKPLQQAYISSTHLPTDQLSQFIRLCLTDSTFPAFVEAVESELNSMK